MHIIAVGIRLGLITLAIVTSLSAFLSPADLSPAGQGHFDGNGAVLARQTLVGDPRAVHIPIFHFEVSKLKSDDIPRHGRWARRH